MAATTEQTQLAQLAELKKQKLQLTAEINKARKMQHNSTRSTLATKQCLASMVRELGTHSMAEPCEIVVSPQLAGHKMKAHLLALFELTGHSTDAAASWLLGQGSSTLRRAYHDVDARSAAMAGVEWLYIFTPDEELESPVHSVPHGIVGLGRWAVEYHLFHWLVKQNCEVGINPGSTQLLVEAMRSMPNALPSDAQEKLRDLFQEARRSTRKWIASFRERWDVKDGMLQPGETLEPQIMGDKAPWAGLVYWQLVISLWLPA
jgi:hypothetical protein